MEGWCLLKTLSLCILLLTIMIPSFSPPSSSPGMTAAQYEEGCKCLTMFLRHHTVPGSSLGPFPEQAEGSWLVPATGQLRQQPVLWLVFTGTNTEAFIPWIAVCPYTLFLYGILVVDHIYQVDTICRTHALSLLKALE